MISTPSTATVTRIYLDHQATTPTDPRVVQKMLPYFTEHYGNAASKDHAFGLDAKRAVDEARRQVADLIGARDDEVIFTSGATEADNLAILGVMERYASEGDHLITVKTEHKAVLDAASELERRGRRVTYLDVDEHGRVDPDDVRRAITPGTVLVSVMGANNEIGTLAPLEEIGRVCEEAGVLFHTDAVQLAGHLPFDVKRTGVHLASLSAHKLYGPKGIGALYRRRSNPRVELRPQMFGGGHERGLRSGTLNVPAIVGFGEAARIAHREMDAEALQYRAWTDRMLGDLQDRLGDVHLNGHPVHRLPHNLNVSLTGVESRALIVELKDVAVATGSACTSASVEPSHVIRALGFSEERAHHAIRISVGRTNDASQIERATERIAAAAAALRAFSLT
jgi:cysteine desulfurase